MAARSEKVREGQRRPWRVVEGEMWGGAHLEAYHGGPLGDAAEGFTEILGHADEGDPG